MLTGMQWGTARCNQVVYQQFSTSAQWAQSCSTAVPDYNRLHAAQGASL